VAKRHSQGTRSLLEEMGDLGNFAEASGEISGQGVRVISLVLDRVRPDPAQPRRVLPASLRDDFTEGRISARQALERWEAIVAGEAAQMGRPRPDWLALMDRKPEDTSYESDEIDPPGQPGPEEDLLRSIVATAATIRHGGQVSPITVYEFQGHYRIETGERRYWAHHWLNMWLSNDYDQIQCIIVADPSPWRQAAENTSRESLSAMALARQVARLLLYMHGLVPTSATHPVSNDWYRQALQLRVIRGEGEHLRSALGGMQRAQFSRYLALLRLPDEVWELADRYRLEEKRLRYVLKVPDKTMQVQLVRAIIEKNLSAERVQQLVTLGNLADFLDSLNAPSQPPAPSSVSEKVAARWPGLAKQLLQADLTVVAEEWLRLEKPEDVSLQAATLRVLLNMVEGRVREYVPFPKV
jgi:hypothetical protein